jgi:signal transduction histidine kinase
VSVDETTSLTLDRLRLVRGPQQTIVRCLRLLSPLLLAVYVVVAFRSDPRAGTTGMHLVVAVSALVFAATVLVSNVADLRWRRVHVGLVVLLLASSVSLLTVQQSGPAPAGALWAVISGARLLPRRAVVPLLVVAFVLLEVVVAVTSQTVGDLAGLAAIAAFYAMLILAFRLTEANRQAESLVVQLRQSQAAQAEAAGLAERQRLAREMHDVLAHSLSGLLLQLEGARMLVVKDPGDPRLPGAIERAYRLGRSGLEEARRAIGMLRDDDLPGPELLAGLAAHFEQDREIPCRLTITGDAHELRSEARLAVYRVAQEALTNIARHARPERVEMRLAYEPTVTHLVVEDFAPMGDVAAAPATPLVPPEEPATSGGYGLTGMRERAELIGGTLTTESTAAGFRIELDVPA